MELIDREALKKTIPATRADIFENCRNCKLLDDFTVIELIDNAPTIDAAPVVYGHWKAITADEMYGSGSYEFAGYCCSKCGFDTDYRSNYCPNCGADMRG